MNKINTKQLTGAGNYQIDLSLVNKGSTVISAGIGRFTKFDEFLIQRKNCKIIGIDPTELAEDYVSSKFSNEENFTFIKKALFPQSEKPITFFERKPRLIGAGPQNPVCESFMTPKFVNPKKQRPVDTISVDEILERYENISILKMDIEGAEYPVIESLEKLEIPQLVLEFHFYNVGFKGLITENQHAQAIDKITQLGYQLRGKSGSNFTFTKMQ